MVDNACTPQIQEAAPSGNRALATGSLRPGGAGFTGSHFVNELPAVGHQVVALDHLSELSADNVNPGAFFVQGSACDSRLVEDPSSRYRFEYVFNLAAYTAHGLRHFIRSFNCTDNLVGSVTLVNGTAASPLS